MIKLRFGCCLNMVALSGDPTGVMRIDTLARCGYDYVELPLAQISEMDDAEFDSLVRTVKASGVPCEVCNNFVPPYVKLVGETANRANISKFFEFTLSRAERLNVVFAGLGSSGARNVPEGFSRETALEQLVEAYTIAGDTASRHGITINIEPLNRIESNILNSIDECVAFKNMVNNKNVKLLIDYYHLAMDQEPVENVLKIGGDLLHTHIARLEERLFPREGDPDDYGAFFSVLKKMGYDSRMSIESYSKDFENDAAISLKYLRSLI